MFANNRWNRIRYTVIAPLYDHVASFGRQRARAVEVLRLSPGDRVLISGAGTGVDLEYLPPDAKVTAVDITPAMVGRIRSRALRLGRTVDAQVGDAQDLTYEDNTFDAVILNLIVAVAPDGRRVLEEAYRVVRAGGSVVVFDKFVPDAGSPPLGRRVVNVITSVLFSDVTRQLGPLIEGIGFQLVQREPAALGGRFEIALLKKPGASGSD